MKHRQTAQNSRQWAAPWRSLALAALIGGHRAGSLGLRPLAPLPFTLSSNQRNLSDPLGFARPFLPSSLCQSPQLRAERIGGVTSFDLSCGVPGNEFRDSLEHFARLSGLLTLAVVFPVPDDRQECTFPGGKCGAGRLRSFSRCSCAGQAHFGGSPLFPKT